MAGKRGLDDGGGKFAARSPGVLPTPAAKTWRGTGIYLPGRRVEEAG